MWNYLVEPEFARDTKVLEENPPQCYFIHHKPHKPEL
jgi:hypothetical protein